MLLCVLLQYYGFIVYRHIFKSNYMTGPLSVSGIRDRGYVLINDVSHFSCVVDASLLTSLTKRRVVVVGNVLVLTDGVALVHVKVSSHD